MSTFVPAAVDLVVVGGGIIGLSVAYEAASAGRSVVVVERARCGGGATPVAAGLLAPVSEAEPTLPGMVAFGLDSCRRYPNFIARIEADSGMSCGYRSEGTLSIATDRQQMEGLEHHAVAHEELGLNAERLTADGVRKLEPALSAAIVGGLRTDIDSQVDPRKLAAALVTSGAAHGVVFAEGAEVASVERDSNGAVGGVSWRRNDKVTGSNSSGGSIETGCVVLCAGAWTRELIPEVSDLPLYPVKGQVIRVRGEALLSHVIAAPGVYLVPRADGEIIVGASKEERGFDERPTVGVTMNLLRQAHLVLPAVAELEISEINVGFRPTFPDHMPAIGAVGISGMFVATGHYRNGIMLAPATATHLLETIKTGSAPEIIAGFDPARFAANGPAT